MTNKTIRYREAVVQDVAAMTEMFMQHLAECPEYIAGPDIAMGIARSHDTLSNDAPELAGFNFLNYFDDKDTHILAAECEGRLIGFLIIDVCDLGGGPCGIFYEFLVQPDFRGQGIGKSLMTQGIERLRNMGVRNCLCTTGRDNTFAHEFLRKNGFRHVSNGFHLIINDYPELDFPDPDYQ